MKEIDNFLGAILYATLVGVEYVKMIWDKWQNI